MIQLIVNNGRDRLHLFPNTRVKLRRQNSLFFLGDILPADFTLPFTLPTAGNARLLDFVHLPEAGRYPIARDVILSVDGGNASFTGQLQLLSSTRDAYKVNLVLKDAALKADTSIRDLVSGTVNFHDDYEGEPIDANSQQGWPNARYCLPGYINDHPEFQKAFLNYSFFSENVAYSINDLVLYNDRVYKCVAAHFGGWDESNFTQTYAYVNRELDGFFHHGTHPTAVLGAKYPMAMFMYLCQVLKDVVAGTGYIARGDVFNDPWMRRQIIWNNFILAWNAGTGIVTEYANLLPDMTLRSFFTSLRDYFGIRVTINDAERVVYFDLMRNIFGNSDTTDWTNYLLAQYDLGFAGSTGMTYNQNFEHDIYPNEVIGKVRHAERFTNVNFRSAYPDTPPFAPYDKKFIYERFSNAYLFFDDDFGFRQTQGYWFDEFKSGNGELNLKPDAGTIPMWADIETPDLNPAPSTLQLLPRVKHLWSDATKRNPFALRFLYYHGFAKQLDGASDYAYATSHGVTPIGGVNVFENGDGDMSNEAMYNRFFKYVDAWLQRRAEYKCRLALPMDKVSFDTRSLTRLNDMNYMWAELDFEFSAMNDRVNSDGTFVRV